MKHIPLLIIAYLLPSCSGIIAGATGQRPPSTPVQRANGTPFNVATRDVILAEAAPPTTVFGLYNVDRVAAVIDRVK